MRKIVRIGVLLGILLFGLSGCKKNEEHPVTIVTPMDTNEKEEKEETITAVPVEGPENEQADESEEKQENIPDVTEDIENSELNETTEENTEAEFIDTDGDGISDKDETERLNTDPQKADTDGDGIDDGEELTAGLNPCSKMSDGNIPDAERTFANEVILENGALEVQGKSNVYEIYAEPSLCFRDGIEGVYGSIYEFYLEGEAFDSAKLTMHYDVEDVRASGFEPCDLQICQVFPDGTKEVVNSSVNDGKGTVTATLEHFSMYALGDKRKSPIAPLKNNSVIIADSGFRMGRDSFSFVNYGVYRGNKFYDGQCYGMAACAQLYYCGKLPLAKDYVPSHFVGGRFRGEYLDGASYSFVNNEEILKTNDGYFDNSLPLYELFEGVSYIDYLKGDIYKRDTEDFYKLVYTQDANEQIEKNPLLTKIIRTEDRIWTKGDKEPVKRFESLSFNLNIADVSKLTEEQYKQYQILSMVNCWHGTQKTDRYKEIYFDKGFGNERQTKGFKELCDVVNSGIPVIVSNGGHAVNLIRIELNPQNPTEFFLVLYDNNDSKNERKVTGKIETRKKWYDIDATYWNNTYKYVFYDTEGIFVKKGKTVDLKFFYAEELYDSNEETVETPLPTPAITAAVKPIPTQSPETTSTPTPTPTQAIVPGIKPIPTQKPQDSPASEETTPVPEVTTAVIVPTPGAEEILKLTYWAQVGEKVRLGYYEQDNNIENGPEEIIWNVIAREGNKALLLSVDCLDGLQFHESYTTITWKDCTLRSWLNGDFYETAFNNIEKAYIITSRITNEKDERFNNAFDGEDTEDKVFLLSKKEVEQYLSFENRVSRATKYAESKDVPTRWGNPVTHWWIRTAAWGNMKYGFYLSSGGWSQDDVESVNGVRPAIWVNLELLKR